MAAAPVNVSDSLCGRRAGRRGSALFLCTLRAGGAERFKSASVANGGLRGLPDSSESFDSSSAARRESRYACELRATAALPSLRKLSWALSRWGSFLDGGLDLERADVSDFEVAEDLGDDLCLGGAFDFGGSLPMLVGRLAAMW